MLHFVCGSSGSPTSISVWAQALSQCLFVVRVLGVAGQCPAEVVPYAAHVFVGAQASGEFNGRDVEG